MGWFKRLRVALGGTPLHVRDLADSIGDMHGDRVVVQVDSPGPLPGLQGTEWTADAIQHFAQRMATTLAQEPIALQPGDTVAVLIENHMSLLPLCLGVWSAGGVVVPLNDKLKPAEVAHILENSGARLVVGTAGTFGDAVGDRATHSHVEHWIQLGAQAVADDVRCLDDLMGAAGSPPVDETSPEPNDVVAVFYTSGTTGKPKGAMITAEGLCSVLSRAALLDSRVLNRDSKAFSALPLAHMYGFSAALVAMMSGTPFYHMGRFDSARVLDVLETEGVSLFIGVPAMYRILLDAGAEQRDLSSVRLWVSAADVVSPDIVERFKRMGASLKVGPLRVPSLFAEGYGMVETSGVVLGGVSLAGMKRERGFVGFAMPGVEVRIVNESDEEVGLGDVGELCIQSVGVLKGYLGAEEATRKAIRDGWLYTGDLVRRGPLGMVEFMNRSHDRMKVGGYSVFPAEIEACLCEHEGVEAAYVFGEPHPKAGEVPTAVIIPTAGTQVTDDSLVAWATQRMAKYKVPRRVVFATMNDLPLGDTGKILRRQLPECFGKHA